MRFVSRIARQLDQMAGPVGVTLATPYYDDRVIEAGLAVRPEERITPWRYKPLIVEAMRGIVPDESLGRQTKANGTCDEDPGLRRHRDELLALWDDSRLGRLGLVDAAALREFCARPSPRSLSSESSTRPWPARCGCGRSNLPRHPYEERHDAEAARAACPPPTPTTASRCSTRTAVSTGT